MKILKDIGDFFRYFNNDYRYIIKRGIEWKVSSCENLQYSLFVGDCFHGFSYINNGHIEVMHCNCRIVDFTNTDGKGIQITINYYDDRFPTVIKTRYIKLSDIVSFINKYDIEQDMKYSNDCKIIDRIYDKKLNDYSHILVEGRVIDIVTIVRNKIHDLCSTYITTHYSHKTYTYVKPSTSCNAIIVRSNDDDFTRYEIDLKDIIYVKIR